MEELRIIFSQFPQRYGPFKVVTGDAMAFRDLLCLPGSFEEYGVIDLHVLPSSLGTVAAIAGASGA